VPGAGSKQHFARGIDIDQPKAVVEEQNGERQAIEDAAFDRRYGGRGVHR
jgi:hypothetical protein